MPPPSLVKKKPAPPSLSAALGEEALHAFALGLVVLVDLGELAVLRLAEERGAPDLRATAASRVRADPSRGRRGRAMVSESLVREISSFRDRSLYVQVQPSQRIGL